MTQGYCFFFFLITVDSDLLLGSWSYPGLGWGISALNAAGSRRLTRELCSLRVAMLATCHTLDSSESAEEA